jgi:hypothetical protein
MAKTYGFGKPKFYGPLDSAPKRANYLYFILYPSSILDTDINCSGMTIKTPSLREFSLKGTAALPLGIIVLTLKLLILFC